MTYKEAIDEIEIIIEEIESEQLDIDLLTEKLKRAKKLFEFCQNKLKETKDSVDKLLESGE